MARDDASSAPRQQTRGRTTLELTERTTAGPSPIRVFELAAASGLSVRLLDLGATLASLIAPDRSGRPGPIALDLGEPERWREPHPHVGGIVGRFANRIAGARFELDGREHRLTRNAGLHHLHGGARGFDARTWEARPFQEPGRAGVHFTLVSPDGEEGYPGRLTASARYTLDDADRLRIDLAARCDRPSVVSLTQHAYWNLEDGGASSTLDHELEIAAHRFAEVDAEGIPTGALLPVAGTPLDFLRPRRIGERIDDPMLSARGGYDHPFGLDRSGPNPTFAARLRAARSGRTLEIHTTQPCLQLYTGQHLDLVASEGRRFGPGQGLCLEAQGFPDAPNQPAFPSTRIDPGDTWHGTIELHFGADSL